MELGNRIVFIGDSITEWGRDGKSDQIGTGYVMLIHDYLRVTYPATRFDMFNRGVGGDRITNLAERWTEDVFDLKPDVVSVSIGINDVWRQLDNPDLEQVTVGKFEAIYRDLLTQVKEKTDAKMIIMEPTIIEEDVKAKGNVLLKQYVDVVHKMVDEFGAVLVPTHTAFVDYLKVGSDFSLTIDGVHMNTTGNMLMAKTWIEAVEKA
ncbi:SGNH/GDSL hydrolase family protein [Aquibacillus kalidii]|uniref:SGNH/GDSL hydrolase family protein n=1 Tax=Aquibacillus kalidii TaxID=2762597 RepID=UPI0016442BEA|nr:SGNH/GDSL hydrolase family protein [Aquibacillus kalidii]